MACKLRITASAEDDRDHIVEYLLHDLHSPQAAGHFLDEMEAVLANVCEFPELNALSRDEHLASLEYRSCRFMNYLLLYKYDKEHAAVTLGRIFHTRQDYAKLV